MSLFSIFAIALAIVLCVDGLVSFWTKTPPKRKLWRVTGSTAGDTYWFAEGYDRWTGKGAFSRPYRRRWRARLTCWWRNFREVQP